MHENLSNLQPSGGADSTAQMLRGALRFMAVVRRHKYIVMVAILVAAGLGVLKLLSDQNSPTVYQATISLLLRQVRPDAGTPAYSATSVPEETYSRVLVSDSILETALASLTPFPPEINRHSPEEEWPRQLRGMLTVRQDSSSSIIEISCKSTKPQIPGLVLNAIVRSAQEFLDSNQQSMELELVNRLDKERTELETRLFRKERELLEAQKDAGEFSVGEDAGPVHPLVQRALDLSQSWTEVQRRRLQLEAALAAARKTIENRGNLRPHFKSLHSFLDDRYVDVLLELENEEALATVQENLQENQRSLAALRPYYGPVHPKVVKLEESIQRDAQYLGQARAKLLDGINQRDLGARLLRLLDESLTVELEREATLRIAYDKATEQAMETNDRLAEITVAKREASLLRELHSTLLDRLARVDISENQAQVRLAVLNEPATVGRPLPKTSPIRTLTVAGFLGLLVGLAIVYGMDVLDDRFRSPEELTEQLGVPALAMIGELTQRAATGIEAVAVHAAPQSTESEPFRTLRTTLAFSGEERQLFAVTSSQPEDGKTTVTTNLGASYAQAGKRTLLVDADLRRPGLTKLLALRGHGGLADVLRSDEDTATACDERVTPSGIDGLDILPSGPRPSNPAELLSSPRLSEVLAWAEAKYDQVIVDCPPLAVAS